MANHRAAALVAAPRKLAMTAMVSVSVAGAGMAAGGVYAALNATAFNTTAQAVGSGTLKLALADNGAGFTQAVSNLAPTDVVNRYVDVTNTGTLDGRALTLTAVDASTTKLSTDATNGLQVTVTSCAGTWTPGTGACSGATTTVVNETPLATMIATPASVNAGTVATGSVAHLRVSLRLPDQVETTANGVLPANTIQGLTANLTWRFTIQQRTGTTTTS